MIGTIVLWIGLAAGLVSTYAYYQVAAGRKKHLRLARNGFAILLAAVAAASALLLVYILRHQFEYAYVWGYSSRTLPLHLLITTFWAGQEGSFLFWALCGSIIGVVLMGYTRRKGLEADVMTVYAVLQSFLLLLLIVKSPFLHLWEAYPNQFAVGHIPPDGRGLNPLLQNFWMVAHPPVLFVGFAAMAAPFAFAIAALWRRRYADWTADALPWIIFSTIALGAGIILGGYWAYGVLGWGGWWGWDPVENSSLIPWLVGVILIHTFVIQRKTGGLIRSNFVLAVLSYILVVYSTFLTRSGILGESSVHSFVDPGALTYTLLLVWIGMALLIGCVMIARRWRDMKPLSQPSSFWSRESLLAVSSAVMGASSLVILFGTSWPILSRASLEPAFYDRTNLPIAIALGLLLGVSLLVQWKGSSWKELARNSLVSLALSICGLLLILVAGVRDVAMALFGFVSFFAFFVNIIRLYRLARENYLYTGGALAHIGLALLFLGIIGSGRYGQKQTAALVLDEPKEVLGYTLTYTGSQPTPDGKWKFTVRAERGESQFDLEPVMYESEYSNSVMRSPDYASFMTGDFYIEPVSLEQGEGQRGSDARNLLTLKKGETQTIGNAQITFVRFEMNHEGMDKMREGGGFAVGAVLEVRRGKIAEVLVPVTIYKDGEPQQPRAARTKDGSVGLELLAMNIDSQTKVATIQVNVLGLESTTPSVKRTSEALIVEVSVKPVIGLIWAAAVLMIAGLVISLRSKLNGRQGSADARKDGKLEEELTQRAQRRRNGRKIEELARGTKGE